jgi:quinol monooxygenase YgiN
MITFIAHFTVPPSNALAFEELLTYVATMSNTESGVVYYGFAKSVDEADTYSVVEVYRDQGAVTAHGLTDWVNDSVPRFLGLIEGMPQIKQYVSPGAAAVASQFEGLT